MPGTCDPADELDVLELFGGQARIARLAKGLGLKAASLDKGYDKEGDNQNASNAMDINTSGGFLLLCCG